MTYAAFGIHKTLIEEEGIDPNTEEYYTELDNRIKITNLPMECTVSIYSLNGVLVRQYVRSNDPSTSLDWDLKNHKNVPIAGGVYIIHVDVPEVGEKILKWFGVMRPIDLDTF